MIKTVGLDQEWVELIVKAKDLGMSTEEVRAFILESQTEGVQLTYPKKDQYIV
ncbi:Anti-repressor SinI [Oceanobacillus limi]|uniref:Anti-repressor SinI n=1 Tax=Oceanobacillus limi TaxID=930131 RepID=A0A1I0CTE4_9BACI|nr:anti-repressor SinI family protein [Oceanobacillus limi]SET22650.1 Anti-repressor SinI [Oceanobacillus limi]